MSLFDLSKDSETAADLALVTCRRTDGPAAARHLQNRALVAAASPHAPETSPGPERPAASAVAAEQGGDEGPAGQPGPSCPAGLAAKPDEPVCPAGECNGRGEVEVGHHTCGTGPDGYYGAHEPGCGTEPCPAGCAYVPPAPVAAPSPEAAEVPVKPSVAAEARAARSEP